MLERVDLDLKLEKDDYKKQLLQCQLRLRKLCFELYTQKRSLVVVTEGWDAAGKGGALRRVTEKLDPRGYQVYGIAAPEGDDKNHHYLWRFWRRLMPPEDKQVLIFDRSWYGRVLVERVEGFAKPEEWKRAYREINEFERQLTDHGTVVVKLWFHISKDEQLRRFEARGETPHKKSKLTDEDWRNRENWEAYEQAVNDMLLKTWSRTAPWTVVEGNDKYWARVKVQRTLIEALENPPDGNGKSSRKSNEKKNGKKKND